MGIYMACQIVRGVFAGLSYGLALWDVSNLALIPGFNLFQAGVAEMIYTFMLCSVVLSCRTNTMDDDVQKASHGVELAKNQRITSVAKSVDKLIRWASTWLVKL